MLNRLKETLLSKTQNAHQAVPELFEYPKLPISQRDCRGSSKILDVKDRREFMLVLCKEMLSILIKMRKEIKSLNLKSSKLTTYTESDEKYLLLKHLYHWAFPQYSYVNKNILLAGLVQFLWDVIHPDSFLNLTLSSRLFTNPQKCRKSHSILREAIAYLTDTVTSICAYFPCC
jgi:hypothetical protein